jgi:hypothetical protein
MIFVVIAVKYVARYAVKYLVKYAVKYAVKDVVKFGLYCKIRRNIATFYLNIHSNLCSLENKSMILRIFW